MEAQVVVNGETIGYRMDGDGRKLPLGDAAMAQQRSNIGMVFQRFNLFPHLNVLENVTLAPVQTKLMTQAEADEYGREAAEAGGHGTT